MDTLHWNGLPRNTDSSVSQGETARITGCFKMGLMVETKFILDEMEIIHSVYVTELTSVKN